MFFDIAIVGAGIAGASLAAEIGATASVLLLEMEDMPGHHATGRSAAFWSETYGGPGIAPLTSASGPWLREQGFLRTIGTLHIGRAADEAALTAFEADFASSGIGLERTDPAEYVPGLTSNWPLGLIEPDCADIDVAGLHAYYLALARKQGTAITCKAGVERASRDTNGWAIRAGGQDYRARILVNAAGAWADDVAHRAGLHHIGIIPYRRTIVQLRMTAAVPDTLPLVQDINGQFYFKAEGRDRLWLSPHDETPSPPCDAAPEELDIAIAIARLEGVVDWKIAAVERKWAGLRSFAPDRLPVYGFDSSAPDFFWFAGQGGFGIQTAPTAAKIGASLLLGNAPDPMVSHIDARRYAPSRFRSG